MCIYLFQIIRILKHGRSYHLSERFFFFILNFLITSNFINFELQHFRYMQVLNGSLPDLFFSQIKEHIETLQKEKIEEFPKNCETTKAISAFELVAQKKVGFFSFFFF